MILIAGRAIGFAVAGYLRGALSRSTTRVRTQITEASRIVITAAAAVLALRQLGIDTTILNILIGAMLFGGMTGNGNTYQNASFVSNIGQFAVHLPRSKRERKRRHDKCQHRQWQFQRERGWIHWRLGRQHCSWRRKRERQLAADSHRQQQHHQ